MDQIRKDWLEKSKLLTEALPYINNYTGKIVVVKYGGNTMLDKNFAQSFCKDIALLQLVGICPIIVHGGGPQISRQQKKNGITVKFIDGFRYTTEESIEIIEMVLAKIGKDICFDLKKAGVLGISLAGKDAGLITANQQIKFGLVGEVDKINQTLLMDLIKLKYIPVISSIAISNENQTLNCNADDVASKVAASLQAKRVFFLSDIPGIIDKNSKQISKLSLKQAVRLAKSSEITGGMLPKIQACIHSVEQGVEAAVILDGKIQNALLLEIFTNLGSGTMISASSC